MTSLITALPFCSPGGNPKMKQQQNACAHFLPQLLSADLPCSGSRQAYSRLQIGAETRGSVLLF
jgi:hypothetical protein